MTPSTENIEAQLRRVLDDAASQLRVEIPSLRSVETSARSIRGGARRGRLVSRAWVPSVGGVLAAITVLAAVGIALAAVALLGHRPPVGRPATEMSRPAPGHGIAGSKAALLARVRSLRGQPIVITVWASWCQPCRHDLGLVAAASRQYGQQLAFLGVDANDAPSAAVSFLRTHPTGFPSYQSTLDLSPILPHALQGIPTTIFIDPGGHVLSVHNGEYRSIATLAHDIAAFFLKRGTSPPSNASRS